MDRDKGFEYLDDTPVEVPVKLRRRDSFTEMVQHVAQELSRRAAEQGGETLEESLDFGPDEDQDLPTPAELRYLAEEELLQDALEAGKVRRQRMEAARLERKLRGRREDEERAGQSGRSGKAGPSDRESESGAVAGDSEKAGRAAKSEGGGS